MKSMILSIAILAVAALGSFAVAASSADAPKAGTCCGTGAACCYPGSPCCK